MVTTRSQAAKKQRSPEATSPQQPSEQQPPPRKKPLGATKLNVPPAAMGKAASKPAGPSEFPLSHPISVSVPPSPMDPAPERSLFKDGAATAAAPAQPPPAAAADADAQAPGEKLLPKPSERPLGPSDKLPDGPEPAQIEVEYLPREQLQPVEGEPAAALQACTEGLEAADWVAAVAALTTLRRLTAHHPDACRDQLGKLIPAVLKSVRSLRSSLCKTAIMAAADLYVSYGDSLLPLSDVGGAAKPATSMLAQLLLKASSNDKKFVIEEAQRALQTMAESTAPEQLLGLVLPYTEHKNPKVRGRAAGVVAVAVARMQPLEVAGFGLPRLVQLSGRLVSDNTPEAREAAKRLVALLGAAFADAQVDAQLGVQVPEPEPAAEGEPAPAKPSKWEYFCRQNLDASAALAVLRASS